MLPGSDLCSSTSSSSEASKQEILTIYQIHYEDRFSPFNVLRYISLDTFTCCQDQFYVLWKIFSIFQKSIIIQLTPSSRKQSSIKFINYWSTNQSNLGWQHLHLYSALYSVSWNLSIFIENDEYTIGTLNIPKNSDMVVLADWAMSVSSLLKWLKVDIRESGVEVLSPYTQH